MWLFKLSDLQTRLLALASGSESVDTLASTISTAYSKVNRWSQHSQFCEKQDDGEDPWLTWVSPLGGMLSLQLVRAQISGTIGGIETFSHVMHLRSKAGFAGAVDEAEMANTATRVKTAFQAWWDDTTNVFSTTAATKSFWRTGVIYSSVTCSAVTYDGTAKPVVDVGGQVSQFSGAAGTESTVGNLPYEVAICLTLRTDTAGRTTRGRIYLPPPTMQVINNDATGTFTANTVKAIAGRFGSKVIDGVHTDSACHFEFQVFSRKNTTSRGIGGVAVGIVPDSQRSRRRSQVESKTVVWGV